MLRPTLLAFALTASPLWAEVPRIATDIAPVAALVRDVLGDLGQPAQILPSGASPHDHAMRPSEARAVTDAELIVWIGPDLSPVLGRAINSLAPDTRQIVLSDQPGIVTLDAREIEDFAGDGHDHDHEAHEGHDHDGLDPHLWLSPENAAIWMAQLVEAISAMDPQNAEIYQVNAERARARLAEAEARIATRLEALHDASLIVMHDAFQYFERHFGLHVVAALTDSDATAPGPATVAAIRERLLSENIECILTEPSPSSGLLDTLTDGTTARVAVLDPLGADASAGYAEFLAEFARGLDACLPD